MNVIPHNINPKAKVATPAVEKDKPRRPLSAYNLFFRFKRQKILDACKEGDIDRETVEGIVNATPGLESVSHDAVTVLPEDELEKFRSDNIRAELGDKLTPKEAGEIKARSHRKTHFKHGLSFLEMTKIISSSWKGVDDLSKKIFEDLAVDGRNIRQQLLADYTKAQEERADSPNGDKNQGQGKVGGKKLASVRPNAIHKPHTGKMESVASQQGRCGGRAAEGSNKECRGGNMNSNHQAIDHMRRMYGERPPQFASVAAAASSAAFASMRQQQMQQQQQQANSAAAGSAAAFASMQHQKALSAAAGSAAAFASMQHQQQKANSAAAGSAAAFASMQQQHQQANSAAAGLPKPIESTFSTQQPSFNPLSNNPYLPKSFFSAHASGRPGNPLNTTSTADKLKMIQLEAANESMKQMLEKLVAANADLEGQNTHLTQLVGQLTAENSTLKRNIGTVTPSFSYHTLTQGHGFPTRHPQGHEFPNSQPHGRHSVTSMESAPNQERLPQQKKRPRVLADPWS